MSGETEKGRAKTPRAGTKAAARAARRVVRATRRADRKALADERAARRITRRTRRAEVWCGDETSRAGLMWAVVEAARRAGLERARIGRPAKDGFTADELMRAGGGLISAAIDRAAGSVYVDWVRRWGEAGARAGLVDWLKRRLGDEPVCGWAIEAGGATHGRRRWVVREVPFLTFSGPLAGEERNPAGASRQTDLEDWLREHAGSAPANPSAAISIERIAAEIAALLHSSPRDLRILGVAKTRFLRKRRAQAFSPAAGGLGQLERLGVG